MTPTHHNPTDTLRAAPAPRRISVTPITMVAAALGIGVGGVALVGWTLDIPRLTTVGVGLDDPVKILTAAGLLAAGTGLLAMAREGRGDMVAGTIGRFSGLLVFLLGAFSLLVRVIEHDGADLPLATSLRMSLNTALALTALGLSFLTPRSGTCLSGRGSRRWWLSQWAALVAATIGYVAIIGHAYSADLLFGFSQDVNMAFPSAVTVFALGLAALCRERGAGLAAEVTSRMAGGNVLRWVVLAASMVIPAIGWVRLHAQDRDLVDYRLGAALFAATSVLLLAAGMWISARRLNRAEASQLDAQEALKSLATTLEQRVAERTSELQTSEQRFRLLAETTPAVVFMADSGFHFEFLNSTAAAFFGSREAALGLRWMDSVHPDDRELAAKRLREAMAGADEFEFEVRLRRIDGEHRWMYLHGVPRRDAQGNLLGFIGAGLDTTDSHRDREALRDALSNREEALVRERSLRRELDHRVRNNLAGLVGLVTFYESSMRATPEAAKVAAMIRGKILAMKEVHDIIAKAGGGSIDLLDLCTRLTRAMLPDQRRAHLRLLPSDGLRVGPQQAAALAIIVQELITNSLKHGAMHQDEGRIDLSWGRPATDAGTLVIEWAESFPASAAAASDRQDRDGGLGLTLIEGFARTDLRGGCSFHAGPGVWRCSITARLEESNGRVPPAPVGS
jgi:PAS domain S-box-containing protein